MSEHLAHRIRERRASDRLAELNPFSEFGAPKPPTAPAEQSSPDCPSLPEAAGATNSLGGGEAVTQRTVNAPIAGSNPACPATFDIGDIPSFLDRRHKQ